MKVTELKNLKAQVLLEIFGWIAACSAILLVFNAILERMGHVNELDSMLSHERFKGIRIEKLRR